MLRTVPPLTIRQGTPPPSTLASPRRNFCDETASTYVETHSFGEYGTSSNLPYSRNGATTARYVYSEGIHPAVELDGAGAVKRVFLYTSHSHVPDFVAVPNGASWNLQRVVTDHLGSVLGVFDVGTNAWLFTRKYDAFGKVIATTNAANSNDFPFGFAGGLQDSVTGLVQFGARTYDPEIGRWLERDPILHEGGINLYEYCGGDPVNAIDPSGRIPAPAQDFGLLGPWYSAPPDHYNRNANQDCPADVASCIGNSDFARDDSGAHDAATFRGTGPTTSGYQCSYAADGTLSQDGVRRRSYDYSAPSGFWGFLGHLAFDVFPAYAWGTGYCVTCGEAYPAIPPTPPFDFEAKAQP